MQNAREPLFESEPYVVDEKMWIYNEDKEKWHGLQAGPCGGEILTQLSADFQGVMTGEMSVDDALKEAEDYANGLLVSTGQTKNRKTEGARVTAGVFITQISSSNLPALLKEKIWKRKKQVSESWFLIVTLLR